MCCESTTPSESLNDDYSQSPDTSTVDRLLEELEPLFNPRKDRWSDHFEWDGCLLLGISPMARATIDVLGINRGDRVEFRRSLIDEGESYP